MTAPTPPIAPGPPARLEEIRSAIPTSGPGAGPADGATFEALVQQAGGLVDELPAPTAASLRRWARPAGALGASLVPAGGAANGMGGLGSSGAVAGSAGGTGVLGLGGVAPHRTGTVFPLAADAGEAVVNAAAEHLGVPYLWGGTDPEKGFDCSGLIQAAYRDIGVELPKWSRHQATMGVEVSSIDEARPGDILSFGQPVNHVGLYVGDGRMLHAPRTGEVVKIEEINRPIGSIRRILAPTSAPTGLSSAGPWSTGSSPTGTGPVGTGATGGSANDPAPYLELFRTAGARWGVDPALLRAVARTESGFDPSAVSPVGAQGLMQFMPATAAEMGVDPWDPASAVDGAARYLRTSLDRYGSPELAIASYNAGRGAVDRHGGIPPFPETQNYVRKVLDAWRSAS